MEWQGQVLETVNTRVVRYAHALILAAPFDVTSV